MGAEIQLDEELSEIEVADCRRERPKRPHEDPFYSPPPASAAARPGTILRARRVEVAFLGLIKQRIDAWQLLYRSTDLHGRPDTTVTTILVPAGARRRDRPVLAYQCAVDAITDRCMPSYALRRRAYAYGAPPAYELVLVAAALRQGWAVSIADHAGIDGRFGAPREPGYRALDGIRAALAFGPLGLSASTPVALWGYSGGGMATSWAAEMADSYAPELNIVGAALGSPVGDPGEAFIKLNATLHTGLPALVLAALEGEYPALHNVIRDHVSVAGRRRLQRVRKLQTVPAVAMFAFDDFDDFLDIPLADVLAQPEVLAVFDDLRLGSTAPRFPLFIVQGVHDQMIDVADVDGQAERYAGAGAHVTYVRDRSSEHITLAPLSAAAVLNWLQARIDGRPLPAPETKTVRSVLFSPSALRGFGRIVGVTARVALGRPITSR